MKKHIRFGEFVYPTKAAALNAIRAVRDRYVPGQRVSDSDASFLLDVLANHPEAGAKIGCGVRSFEVERNQGGTIGFWLTRIDGSRTDWSFLSCVTPATPRSNALAAMRTEIREQIFAFRDAMFPPFVDTRACAVTGDPVTRETAHVDHAIPFLDLAMAWADSYPVGLENIAVIPTADGDTTTRMADRSMAKSWADFHAAKAQLRLVSARANLSLLRRGVR